MLTKNSYGRSAERDRKELKQHEKKQETSDTLNRRVASLEKAIFAYYRARDIPVDVCRNWSGCTVDHVWEYLHELTGDES